MKAEGVIRRKTTHPSFSNNFRSQKPKPQFSFLRFRRKRKGRGQAAELSQDHLLPLSLSLQQTKLFLSLIFFLWIPEEQEWKKNITGHQRQLETHVSEAKIGFLVE
ncbi:hypothetical protein L6164_022672 [Bauhinia variegata]|uniref:Uncharacterized protein n=1 Tax=Bauhinia variegata TaxID=167791 RepID=A0ACB9MGB8_BAUVA|nr:hypothetical protein L6164_022672 [Bauhinia variegata]